MNRKCKLPFGLGCLLTLAACSGDDSRMLNPDQQTDALPPATSEKPPPSWHLIWRDEFDTAISANNWNFEINCWGGGNNEHQCYTDRAENAFVDEGILHIVAIEEAYSGPALQDEHPDYDSNDTSASKNYTSARLRTRNLFDFTYGRVEIRAQLPAGQGTWPALWMLPTELAYGTWPLSGEIDILEAVNLGTENANNEIHGTLHYGMPWPQWSNHGAPFTENLDYTGEFHTYAIEWEADEIRWFVDGIHYQTQSAAGWYNYTWQGQDVGFTASNPRAPYDQNFHLLMNLAIGGDWPGPPDTGWKNNRALRIDYVRVYQCQNSNEEGTGCASTIDKIDPTVEINEDAGAPGEKTWLLFDGTLQPLQVKYDGITENTALLINSWQETQGNLNTTISEFDDSRGAVWDLNFNGLANVFIGIDGENSEGAVALEGGSAWSTHGVLSFDIYINQIDAETGLTLKLDSGYPNLGQLDIELPPVGEWARVHFPLASFLDKPLESGSGLNTQSIHNLFVLETSGTHSAHIYIDNIQLQCAVNPTAKTWQADRDCDIRPVPTASNAINLRLPLYDDAVDTSIWDLGYREFSTQGDHITESEVDIGGGDRVLDLLFENDGADGVAWLEASQPQNLRAFEFGGALKLDIRVLDWGSANSPLMIKMECPGDPCSSGDYAIGDSRTLNRNRWHSISIPLGNLLENAGSNLNLSQVSHGLVIFPTWGDSQGVHFQINNARIEYDYLSIFEGQTSHWDAFDCCGGSTIEMVDDPTEPSRGKVLEFRYATDTTVTYLQSSVPLDLSEWAGGSVEFDMYIETQPENAAWFMKVDCEHPCSTGDVPLLENTHGVTPVLGVWQHYQFGLDKLVTKGLELNHVDTPLVIFPGWGNQNGAIYRIDNVKVLKAP